MTAWEEAVAAMELLDRCVPTDQRRRQKELECGERLRSALSRLIQENESSEAEKYADVGVVLLFFQSLARLDRPIWGGIRLGSKECSLLEKYGKEVKKHYAVAVRNRAESLIDYALDRKKKMFHPDRQALLERAIHMVRALFGTKEEWPEDSGFSRDDACRLIADSYLGRSLLIFPKGERYPPKKVEALQKSLEWLRKTNPNDLSTQHMLTRLAPQVEPYPEVWEALLADFEIDQIFREFFSNGVEAHNILDVEALVMGFEKGWLGVEQVEWISNFSPRWEKPQKAKLKLLQAKVALVRSDEDQASKFINECVDLLEHIHFSNFLWDEVMEIIGRLEEGPRGELALKAFESAKRQEDSIKLPIYFRWYWTRLRGLFELAFQGALHAGDLLKAAQVADHVKSRPRLMEREFEKGLGRDEKTRARFAEIMDLAVRDHLGQYAPTFRTVETQPEARTLQPELERVNADPRPDEYPPSMTSLPPGWAAVHLFGIGGQGWAIVIDSKEVPHCYCFNAARLWESYRKWHTSYLHLSYALDSEVHPDLEPMEASLGEFSMALGQELDFLFSLDQPCLCIIPYGFLHLAPIHAATHDGEYLVEKKACCYLPAWSYAQPAMAAPPTAAKGLFINWCGNSFDRLYDDWDGMKLKKAGAQAVIDFIKENPWPELLAILCHGHANNENPYLSGLVLEGGDLTHLHAIKELPAQGLKGSCVVLGACETDLAPSNTTLLDEHLSMASAFLHKGARMVLGSLWMVHKERQKELMEALYANSTDAHLCLQECQRNWIHHRYKIHRWAPFRILGVPFVSCDKQMGG